MQPRLGGTWEELARRGHLTPLRANWHEQGGAFPHFPAMMTLIKITNPPPPFALIQKAFPSIQKSQEQVAFFVYL